ncbi:MAG: hypothetical protein QOE22_641 [Candidatus Parcubacteria bacterium]|jgi:tellurite resistance protein TehA-like permease|nr:hypothetical protein [Candidatus Parcubacteria bacterium]
MNGSEKVEAFPTPSFLSLDGSTGGEGLGGGFGISDLSVAFPVIFAIVFFIWVAYTLVLAYHWFRYGHRSFLAVPMLVLHVVVSGTLMLLAAAGLR